MYSNEKKGAAEALLQNQLIVLPADPLGPRPAELYDLSSAPADPSASPSTSPPTDLSDNLACRPLSHLSEDGPSELSKSFGPGPPGRLRPNPRPTDLSAYRLIDPLTAELLSES
jgi:hypothetical protein